MDNKFNAKNDFFFDNAKNFGKIYSIIYQHYQMIYK